MILVAAALQMVGRGPARERPAPTMRAVYLIPPGAAAVLVAAAGVFIFVTGIDSR